MPRISDAIGFEDGLLQGSVTFGREARERIVGADAALAARLGGDWEREGRVSVNPATLDCGRYLAGCTAERQDADPARGFGLGLVDTPSWGSPVTVERDESGTIENTRATLVAFTPQDEPAGHVGLNVSIWISPSDWRVMLYTDVLIVYVRPRHRGKGYGVDLSVAGDRVMRGIVETVLAAIPDGASFRFTGVAEYLSKGGERVCRTIWHAAEAAQAAHRHPDRPHLVIEPVLVHAGR